jgi:cyanophycinase
MMRRAPAIIANSALFLVSALTFLAGPTPKAQAVPPAHALATIGPQNGWLVLHGGGTNKENGVEHRFAQLAGGAKANIVIVLTPIDLESLTPDVLTKYKAWWSTEYGVANVTFMDTRDRRVADTDAFVAPLRNATGVWITGGHLQNLLDVYLGTKTAREIAAVADRGGVIGGSSAGAMIQGSFLINVTKTPGGLQITRTKMFLDTKNLAGFGILKNVTVYPHLDAREAEKDVSQVIAHYPDLLGIGLDEGAGAIVHNDQLEVIGAGHVAIFDAHNPSRNKIQTLSVGQKFDLKKRTPVN